MKVNNVYNVKKIDESNWEIIPTNGIVPVDVISKDDIEEACHMANDTEPFYKGAMDENLDSVWDELIDNFFRVAFINPSTLEYRQFTAWFDCICAECIGKIITEHYKELLLNIE